MLDHTGVSVSDPKKSRRFYEEALAPLGYQVLMEVPPQFTGGIAVLGLGVPPKPDFWIHEGTPQTPRVHVAFRADIARSSTRSTKPRWPPAGPTTDRPAYARIITPTITARSFAIPTATTSRRVATCLRADSRRVRPAGSEPQSVLLAAGCADHR